MAVIVRFCESLTIEQIIINNVDIEHLCMFYGYYERAVIQCIIVELLLANN